MPLFSTTLTTAVSTTPGASAICNVDRIGGKPITASVIPSAGSSGAFVLQYSLDDVIAGIRINSTALAGGTFTLKVVQPEGQ